MASWIWITSKNVELQNDPKYDPAVLMNQVCVQQPNVNIEACQRRLAEDLIEEAPLKAALKAEDARDAILSALGAHSYWLASSLCPHPPCTLDTARV